MLISASILRGYKSICILKRAIFHTWVKINSVANGPNQSLICIPCEVLPGFFLFFFVNIYIQQLPLLLVNGMCSLHFCLLWDDLAGLSAYWKPFVVQTSLDCYNDDNAHLLWNKILNACLFFFFIEESILLSCVKQFQAVGWRRGYCSMAPPCSHPIKDSVTGDEMKRNQTFYFNEPKPSHTLC